jgi:hypothetical protein
MGRSSFINFFLKKIKIKKIQQSLPSSPWSGREGERRQGTRVVKQWRARPGQLGCSSSCAAAAHGPSGKSWSPRPPTPMTVGNLNAACFFCLPFLLLTLRLFLVRVLCMDSALLLCAFDCLAGRCHLHFFPVLALLSRPDSRAVGCPEAGFSLI